MVARHLSNEQLGDFGRDGFVVVPGMFGPEEMARIAAWTDEVAALPEVPGKYMMYFEDSLLAAGERVLQRLENFYPYHTGFKDLFEGDKLRGSAAELLGEPAVLFKEKINFKMPGGDGFKPHQDQQAGWGVYADLFITALVSIDEATVANGCLEMAAGFHDKGLVGAEWAPLDDRQMRDMDFITHPTLPGDVVLFDSYAPHGSKPNLTDSPRRVLYITYNRAADGDHREQYYADKRKSFPPDIERDPDKTYVFRV